jgi:hypothetical protein
MISIIPCSNQSYFDFFIINESTVILIHTNGLFDIIDLNTRWKIKSFGLGPNVEVLKSQF